MERLKKYRILAALSASILLLIALGVEITIIYSDYVYTPNKGYTLMMIMPYDMQKYFGVTSGMYTRKEDLAPFIEEAEALADELDAWAEDNKVSLLIEYYSAPGILFTANSDLKDRMRLQSIAENGSGLYLNQSLLDSDYFYKDGVFLPEYYAIPVEGFYDPDGLPEAVNDPGKYLLSLKRNKLPPSGLYQAIVLTDAKEMSGLLEIMDQYGFSPSFVRANEVNAAENLKKLFSPLRFHNGVLLLGLLSILGGFAYLSITSLYSRLGELRIRHLLGMSFRRIMLKFSAEGITVFCIGSVLSLWMMQHTASYMPSYDMGMIRQYILAGLLVPVLTVYGGGILLLCRLLRRI